jgi:transposase
MLFAGIDWGDKALDYHLRTSAGKVLAQGRVTPDPDGLADLFVALETRADGEQIGIAIETSHGAWMQALLDRGYTIYPVNPKAVDSFREAMSANGDKSDKIDRRILAIYLATFHRTLRPLRPDDPEIIALRIACKDRVRLVEERTSKLNELRAILKVHYPAVLSLFADLDSIIALEFLRKYPTQNQMQKLTERRLRKWLSRHHYSWPTRVDKMVGRLKQPALPIADHLQQAKANLIQYLAKTLIPLKAEIAARDKAITAQFAELPEADWARSLPGAGTVLAPAILACIGRDTERFATPADAQAFMGTAPVTKASGMSRSVIFRRGCWKFARRTLQLFANASRPQCAWAERFYQKQRDSGHKHHSALRALAHKWLKIILAMQRNDARYVEAVFVESQQRYLSKQQALSVPDDTFLAPTLT